MTERPDDDTERLDDDQDETARTDRLDTASVGVARVNLLPPEIARERRTQRVAAVSVGVLVAYLGALGALYALKLGDVADARDERDTAAAAVAGLQTELETLAEFQTLADDIQTREALLTAAMADELSWARVFGEFALSFSRDASLTDVQAVTANSEQVAAGVDPTTAEELPQGTPVGQITFTGYSIERVAPGVQEVLSEITEADGFVDSYLTTTTNEERGGKQVTNFEGRVELDDNVQTRRYDDGLPQETIQ